MAGSSWPALTSGNRARASDVVSRFQWIEGSIVPMTGGSSTDGVFDLGTTTARWNNVYVKNRINLNTGGGTTASVEVISGGQYKDSFVNFQTNADQGYVGAVGPTGGSLLVAKLNSGDMFIRTENRRLGISVNQGSAVCAVFDTNQSMVVGNTSSANASALLEIAGTKAILLPRLSTAQRDALTAAEGMAIYNSTLTQFQAYENGAWVRMIGAAIGMQPVANTSLTWTAGTTASTNLLSYTGAGRLRKFTVVTSGANTPKVNIVMDGNTIASHPIAGTVGTMTAYNFQIPTTTGFIFGFSTTAETVSSYLNAYFRSTLVVEGSINATQSGSAQLIMEWEHQ